MKRIAIQLFLFFSLTPGVVLAAGNDSGVYLGIGYSAFVPFDMNWCKSPISLEDGNENLSGALSAFIGYSVMRSLVELKAERFNEGIYTGLRTPVNLEITSIGLSLSGRVLSWQSASFYLGAELWRHELRLYADFADDERAFFAPNFLANVIYKPTSFVFLNTGVSYRHCSAVLSLGTYEPFGVDMDGLLLRTYLGAHF